MRYVEYAQQVHERSATMLPVTALPELFKRPDAGYCSLYQFSQEAAFAIRLQGNSQGLGRFPVYSDRLWIDIDREDVKNDDGTVTKGVDIARAYTRELAGTFKQSNYAFSVWESGGKGFHICIKITPMEGVDVPHSQAEWLRALSIKCDYSLYQHGRLFSNPGRKHPKTGVRKNKIMEHAGTTILTVPIVPAPTKTIMATDELTRADHAKIAFSRLSGTIADASLLEPGNRHTRIWSLSMQMLEAGMSEDLVLSLALYVNSFLPQPKTREEIEKCVTQAVNQS